jgi:hypothetical protein
MKIYIRKLYSFLIVFIAVVFLFPAACSSGGGDNGDDPPVDNPVKGEMTAATAAKIFDYTAEAGSIKITLFKDTAELNIYLGGSASLVLNTIGGRPVSVIEAGAFKPSASGGQAATLPAGVSSVKLPETLTGIAEDSFEGAGITQLFVPQAAAVAIGSSALAALAANSGAAITTVSSGSILVADDVDMAKIGVNPAWPLDGNYVLTANLTLNNWMPIGAGVGAFTGTFDGNGKTITLNGFDSAAETTPTTVVEEFYGSRTFILGGLFAYTGSSAVIKNFTINLTNLGTDLLPLNMKSVGGVAGFAHGTILNIAVTGAVVVSRSSGEALGGGIAGIIERGSITDSYSTATITIMSETQKTFAGGIVGNQHTKSSVTRCYASGTIAATSFDSKEAFSGGITGALDWSGGTDITINSCVALNPSVSSFSSFFPCRIAHSWPSLTTGSNYGNSAMSGGTWGSNATGSDGADVALSATEDQSWWTDTAGWTIGVSGSETSPWVWDSANSRPKLWFEP